MFPSDEAVELTAEHAVSHDKHLDGTIIDILAVLRLHRVKHAMLETAEEGVAVQRLHRVGGRQVGVVELHRNLHIIIHTDGASDRVVLNGREIEGGNVHIAQNTRLFNHCQIAMIKLITLVSSGILYQRQLPYYRLGVRGLSREKEFGNAQFRC